jgi:hypothetical protein
LCLPYKLENQKKKKKNLKSFKTTEDQIPHFLSQQREHEAVRRVGWPQELQTVALQRKVQNLTYQIRIANGKRKRKEGINREGVSYTSVGRASLRVGTKESILCDALKN